MDYEKLREGILKHEGDLRAYQDYYDLCRTVVAEDDFNKGHKWNHELRDMVGVMLRKSFEAQDWIAVQEYDALYLRTLLFGGREFFDDYLQAVEYGKPFDKKFYAPRRGYLKRYVDAYQEILDGKLDFLSVSMPKRAIEKDCPVLTPTGFVRHGDLKVGDEVIGEDGEPVKVLEIHPDVPMEYRITFMSGDQIVCNGKHEWKVYSTVSRHYHKVTAEHIAQMGVFKFGEGLRYYIPECPEPHVLDVYTTRKAFVGKNWITRIERLSDRTRLIGNCITVEGSLYRVGYGSVLTHNCGKSQMGINFVNMLSGRRPDKSTLMEGTGDDLVRSFYSGCLEYLQQPNDYHFYDIFPEAVLTQTNADTKSFNLQTRHRFPTVMCRSIDSRQVGLSEATNLLYLDDCVEGREEAKNRMRLDAKWEVISGDVIGRAIEGTPIVICGTRYSIYDPIGHLQEEMQKQGKRVKIVETPALDPVTDESNFEFELEGKKIFTTKYFRDQREMLSAEQFESEFQQQPFEAKGLLFPVGSLKTYFELPVDVEPDAVVAVCDTADTGADYCAMPIAYVYGDDVFIHDVLFDDAPPEVTKPECARLLADHKVSTCTFESNNAGSYFARDVDSLLKEKGAKCSIRTKRTISNKRTRIEFASDLILKNFYFLHPSKYARNSQYAMFMKQVTGYTRSGKVPHDDAPDSLSLLENELRTRIAPKVEVLQRFF